MDVLAIILAAEQGSSGEIPLWAQYGILGLIIVGFITRQLVPGWMYSDLRTENESLKAENKDLVRQLLDVQKTALPALQSAASIMDDAMDELRSRRRAS